MKALDALRQYGWIKKDYGSKDKGFCSVGAIDFAYGGDFTANNKATNLLDTYIKKKYNARSIVSWNDSRKRTKRQVLAAFRAVNI